MTTMSLRPNSLPDEGLVEDLQDLLGDQFVSADETTRIAYSRDMWPRSLIRQRFGTVDSPPGVVVWPADAEQVGAIVRLAVKAGIPVIPFGAGSGVCGGTLPLHGGIVLDLKRLDKVLSLSESDQLLHVEAGVIGEVLERELNRRGWTLGHFPSSIYCSTVGGWLAGRSAGQCSSRYGKIEDMCRSLSWVDASGELCHTPALPPGYAPWGLDPLLLGSEGTLGVITSAELIVRPLPRARWFRGFRMPDVDAGISAMRLLLREGLRPAVVRLYDPFDTLIAKTGSTSDLPEQQLQDGLFSELGGWLSGSARALFKLSLKRVLQAPRLLNRVADMIPGGCLLIVVHEGDSEDLEPMATRTQSICASLGGEDLGEGPGRHWWEHRYSISYKQSPVFAAGGFVDTMEIASTWDRLPRLYRAVKNALNRLAFVMAHFSHAYREGGSIYFTFAAAASDDAAAATLYDQIWDAAQQAVLSEGAVVSHHHGVGLSKARYLVRQLGEANSVGAAIKRAFDPAGVFNPGKLGQPQLGRDRPKRAGP